MTTHQLQGLLHRVKYVHTIMLACHVIELPKCIIILVLKAQGYNNILAFVLVDLDESQAMIKHVM